MDKPSRRDFLKTVGLSTAALAMPGRAARSAADRKAPNVLFLFSDDQRFDTVHSVNCPQIQTPNLDRLVRKGVTFTRAHIMGGTSGAVCMPSRAMLMTGRTLFHLENRGSTIPADHVMMPELFRKAGYKTFATGKWHNGRSAFARAFTHGGRIMFGGMSDHWKVPVYDFDPEGVYPSDRCKQGETFSSELFTDEAIRFLEEDSAGDPFFAYVSYTAPHDPRHAPHEYGALYPADQMKLPPNFLPEHPFDNGEMDVRDEQLAPRPRQPETIKEHLGAYYAMISHMDTQIGRLLDTLERTNKAANTIIVFAADNGLAVGSHGLLGKQNLYDHSVRVPLIMCGPGIPEGGQADGLCYLSDVFPTLCTLTGLPRPATVEGIDLAPLLEDPAASVRDSVFLAYTKLQRGVRTENDWKLIKYNVKNVQTSQLFDLKQDPHEMNNLAEAPEHAARLEALCGLLIKQMADLDDFCDLDEPNWGLPPEVTQKKKVKHLALNREINLKNSYSPRYTGGGPNALIDGIRATSKYTDGAWQGFEGCDFIATIDLGKRRTVSKVTAGFLENHEAWIFLPGSVAFALSEDGVAYQSLKKITIKRSMASNPAAIIKDIHAAFEKIRARYVRVHARNIGICPGWHQGAGGKAWIFIDEICVV